MLSHTGADKKDQIKQNVMFVFKCFYIADHLISCFPVWEMFTQS